MAFLNPLVLLGLAAAAIPLIIHLFNFRKPKRVDFSSLAFLRELEKKTMRRVRLKQWLLLALRTLAIVSLVLAFARPTRTSAWQSVFGDRAPAAIAVVVDNSLSMTMRDAQGAYLAQAKVLASELIESAALGDEMFLVSTARTPEERAGSAPPSVLLDRIEELTERHSAEAASAAISRAASLLEGATNPVREIYLISDLQASTFVDSMHAVLPDGLTITLMPLGTHSHENAAVTDVEIVSRILEPGRPVELSATMVRFGERAEGYGASVILDGARVAQQPVDLPERTPVTTTFAFSPPVRGWLGGEVRVEPDEAEWDDVRYFTLRMPEPTKALVVRSAEARADHVLVALGVAAERGAMRLTTIDGASLATAGLVEFDVVVLVGQQELSGGEVALLQGHVESGGGLILFPGERHGALNDLLRALGAGAVEGTLTDTDGGTLGGFGATDLEHPLFQGMFEEASGPPRLENPSISRAVRYAPAGIDESTVIRLAGGPPFLQEIRHGQGAVLLYTVAPDDRWSDLSSRGLFVPLLYRSVAYTASTGPESDAALGVANADAIRVDGVLGTAPVRVLSRDGQEWIPPQRSIPGGVLLDLGGELTTPGVYQVVQGGTPLRQIAVNQDILESDLSRLSSTVARERLEAATGRPVRVLEAAGGAATAAAEQIRADRRGVDLSSLFLVLALCFLVAEMFVAMRWKPEEQ